MKAERAMINPLTGLRAVAAAWVVLFHLREYLASLRVSPAVQAVADSGLLGVDIFFVLSGFIISLNYLQRLARPAAGGIGRFLWFRLARLYPVHLTVLALLLCRVGYARLTGAVMSNPEMYGWGDLARNLSLTHAWTHVSLSWYGPAWSISAEFWAYLLFPLMAFALARPANGSAAVAASLGTLAATLWFKPLYGDYYYIALVSGEFTGGCLLFAAFRSGTGKRLPWEWLVPAFAGAGLLAIMWNGAAAHWSVPCFALALYGLAFNRGWVARWLGSRVMVYLGEISYSMYMTHALVILVMGKLFSAAAFAALPLVVKLAVLAATLAAIVAVAGIMCAAVEQPARKVMQRLADPPTSPRGRAPG